MHFVFSAPIYHTNQRFAVKALLEAGHRVSFVALWREHSEAVDELEPIVVGKKRLVPWLHGREWVCPPPFTFWSLMRKLRPEVVVVRNPFTAYGLMSIMAAKAAGSIVVLYNQAPKHTLIGRRTVILRSLLARMVGRGWITPVLGWPDLYPSRIKSQRYVPFVMEPRTPPVHKRWFRGGSVNVLSVGKFQELKNHVMFLEVVARLAQRHHVRATVIGECTTDDHRRELSRVKETHARLGLQRIVEIKTNLPYHDVQREYAEHDLFVLASRKEPAAVSPLEAMAHSLPVISSNYNGTHCYIRHGENGYVFRSDDAGHLEDCMERIIADRARLVEMGAASYALVVSEHCPDKYVETMLELACGAG